MHDFFHKNAIFSVFLAGFYSLFSVWTLGVRLFSTFAGSAAVSGGFRQAESILSACLFSLVPCILFALSARHCTANAKTAMCAASAAKLMALIAYCASMLNADGNRLLPLVFCLSLGSAISEVLTFLLIAITLRKSRLEAIISWLAAVFCAVHHTIYLIELYASMQLLGNGYVGKWLPLLSSASTAEFFTSIIKGAVCALVFLLLYEECKKPCKSPENAKKDASDTDAAQQ